MFNRSFWLLLLAARLLSAAEPFQLKLTDFSGAWFDNGAVIRVPNDKCSEIQVKLAEPWSQQFGVDALELRMDDAYPRFTRSASAGGYLLTIRTREPLGLLPRMEHHVEVSATGRNPLHGEWTILRWERAYIQAAAVDRQGIPLGIRIDQPPGGVVIGGSNAKSVRFRGEVIGSGATQVLILNQKIKRLPDKPGFQFDEQISVAVDVKEIVVVATEDGQAGATTLVLPVSR